jgi:hypothetical protein
VTVRGPDATSGQPIAASNLEYTLACPAPGSLQIMGRYRGQLLVKCRHIVAWFAALTLLVPQAAFAQSSILTAPVCCPPGAARLPTCLLRAALTSRTKRRACCRPFRPVHLGKP